MAQEVETRDEHWGELVARVTFITTIIGAVLFIGAVFLFIL